MKVGKEENDKLYLNLKCTKGEMHEFPWVHRYSMDWNNPEKIKAANIWYVSLYPICKSRSLCEGSAVIPSHDRALTFS